MSKAIFQNQVGQFVCEKTTVWSGHCHAYYAASFVRSLDFAREAHLLNAFLTQGFMGLNAMVCPQCGSVYEAEEPFALHLPNRLILVVPERDNHRILKVKSDFIRSLEPEEGDCLPPYALDFELVSAPLLADFLERQQVRYATTEAPVALKGEETRVAVPQTDMVPRFPSIHQEPWETASVRESSIVNADTPILQSDAPAFFGAPEKSPSISEEALRAEFMESCADECAAQDEDDWGVAPLPEEPPAREPPKLFLQGKSVVLKIVPEESSLSQADIRFQLHQTPFGFVPMLAFAWGRGESAEICLDPQDEEHAEILNRLEQNFEIKFKIYSESGECIRAIEMRAPLESNVARARELLQESLADAHYDGEAARDLVNDPQFDRVGKLNHNFNQHSFEQMATAAEARLALGIFSYWFEPERRDYLLSVKSFPVIWYEMLVDRILYHAIEFGLAMDPALKQCAIDRHFADNALDLLKKQIQAFAEVSLSLKPSDLDPMEIWENWQLLLQDAESLDFHLDPNLEELVVRCMERAKESAEAHLDEEAAFEASESVELPETRPERKPEDWLNWLKTHDEPGPERLQAVCAVADLGDSESIPLLSRLLPILNREELLLVIPKTLKFGTAFEAAYLQGLRSKQAYLAWASVLCLGEMGSDAAVAPLMQMLRAASPAEWPLLAREIARMGPDRLALVLDDVALNGDPEDRVAYTLALMAKDARGILTTAKAPKEGLEESQGSSQPERPQAVLDCLDEALAQVDEVEFGDAADFSERLEHTFDAVDAWDDSPALEVFEDSSL